jgi:hypothetical protein
MSPQGQPCDHYRHSFLRGRLRGALCIFQKGNANLFSSIEAMRVPSLIDEAEKDETKQHLSATTNDNYK